MEVKECKICGKKIEGYSQRHVAYLMMQHNFKHEVENGKYDAVQSKTEKTKEKKDDN